MKNPIPSQPYAQGTPHTQVTFKPSNILLVNVANIFDAKSALKIFSSHAEFPIALIPI